MKKKYGVIFIMAVYVLLLFALTAAEASFPNASIRSVGDALWYSLVTITTVGYGDLYPVSPAGRIIGVFFLLLSVGALAFAVSVVFSLLTGRFIPQLVLLWNRNRRWFVFSEMNAVSAALAQSLLKTQPDSLMVFCRCAPETNVFSQSAFRAVHTERDADFVMRFSKAGSRERTVFFVGGDALKNCDEALSLREAGAQVYCLSEENSHLPGLNCFDPHACCARQFWMTHFVHPQEKSIVIIGSGRYAQALLSHALLINCRTPFASSAYHLFGDWSEYRRNHVRICQTLSTGSVGEETDTLHFHEDAWNADPDLLARADRIIFCADDGDENARAACVLQRCFAYRAALYVRTASCAAPGTRFGAPEEIYTQDLVMKSALDQSAIIMHEQYRQGAGGSVPVWEELNSFLKDSNRSAADHLPTKFRLLFPDADVVSLCEADCMEAVKAYRAGGEALIECCRRNEHERWMRFHLLHNWQYAPQRDNKMHLHPNLVPFDQLNEQEKAKDDYAWMMFERLGSHVRNQERV